MGQNLLWVIFILVFVAAISLDLFVFQRRAHIIPVKEALKLVVFWVSLALAFFVLVYFTEGPGKGVEFITAYLVEYSLSVDNLFVFLALLTYFMVPREAHRKVLLWGILGAIFFRGIFIFAGIALIERFSFLLYILGVLLIYTAFRLITQKEKELDVEKNPLVRLARKFMRVTPHYYGASFFKKIDGLTYATPLVIVIVAIETMDVMFATDSVPAVFGVTLDPFIVYTSNVFAILGLRALFFAIAGIFYLFRYLVYGLSLVLAFVGVKMLIVHWYTMPPLVSLAVIGGLLFSSVLVSVLVREKQIKEITASPDSQEKEGNNK